MSHAVPPSPSTDVSTVRASISALPQPPEAAGRGWTPGTCLRVDLQLCRAVQRGQWTAELSVPGVTGRLSFPSLQALGSYISRLDTAAAASPGVPIGDEAPPAA